ncbi:MAG: methyltransferase [Azospirillaceae bacterium]|nr:methyltransferase [Azospirillaceae bacterium]
MRSTHIRSAFQPAALALILSSLVCLAPLSPVFAQAITPVAAATDDAALVAALQGPWRSPANRARDADRHPRDSLVFWGLKPGDTIVEVEPGARGWWTEILAPYAKATGGTYVAALPDRGQANPEEDPEPAHIAFWKGVADQSIFGAVKAYDFGRNNTTAIPAASADLVLVARAFHNWARQGDTTDVYLRAFFTILKPGGILAVEQHRAPEGSDPRAGTGYVPESYVIDAAQRAGFILDARSDINANPKDTRDHPFGVWTLPPTRRSAAPGQPPDPDFDHRKYDAIGESDRMTLRFHKPA